MPRVETVSERGGGHQENEDAFAIRAHPADATLLICVVADGQGGQRGGGPAARLACETVVGQASKMPAHLLEEPASWLGILQAADKAVDAEPVCGFTTLIGFAVSNRRVCGAANGDSAVAIRYRSVIDDLTKGQEKNPPIGSGFAAVVPFGAKLKAPWTILAMTDGVWRFGGWDSIAAAKDKQGKELLDALLAGARLPAGKLQDDFTLVVIDSENASA
jgi:hypothetical protein